MKPAAPSTPDRTIVPRPVAPAVKPQLIDISKAPSSMELAVASWKGKK